MKTKKIITKKVLIFLLSIIIITVTLILVTILFSQIAPKDQNLSNTSTSNLQNTLTISTIISTANTATSELDVAIDDNYKQKDNQLFSFVKTISGKSIDLSKIPDTTNQYFIINIKLDTKQVSIERCVSIAYSRLSPSSSNIDKMINDELIHLDIDTVKNNFIKTTNQRC